MTSEHTTGLSRLIGELERRNVIRIGAGYAVMAWLLIQLAETILPLFGFDEAPTRMLVIILAIGFVPALVLAWIFEWTPKGVVLDQGQDRPPDPGLNRRIDRIIIAALAVAVALLAAHVFVIDPARDEERVAEAEQAARTGALKQSFGDRSIAVLPFVNMSPDPEQAYFSDGIAEEMLNLLVRVEGLRVISRTSSFQFKGTELSIPEIAERLDVVHILEGSVRKAGNQVRITAQLIDARSDTHLWSETFDRTLDDIFAIQDDVARRVVAALKLAMDVEVPTAVRHDPAAYAMVLQANQLSLLDDPTHFDRIQQLLDQALTLEPDYVDAKVALASLLYRKAVAVWHDGESDLANELRRQRKAILDEVEAVDPGHARYNTLRGFDEWGGDPQAAARRFEQALETNPRDHTALLMAMMMSAENRRFDLAIRIGQYLTRRDPMGFWAHVNLADAYLHTGRYEEALSALRTAATISPSRVSAQWKLGFGLLVNGRAEEALERMNREPHENYRLHGRAIALHDLGDEAGSAEAMAALHALEEGPDAVEGGGWPYGFARAYAWMGNVDQAMAYLERVLEEGERGSLSELATHPYFDRIRADPRFQRFLKTVEVQLPEIEFDPILPPELLVAP